jgi:hypothetical protein
VVVKRRAKIGSSDLGCKEFEKESGARIQELGGVVAPQIVLVFVIEKAARFNDVPLPTAWRGAALACAPSPRDFRLDASAAETRENKRLPRTTHGYAYTRGVGFPYTRTIELHRAG